MLTAIVAINLALFVVDRFLDLGALLPLVVFLTIGVFVSTRIYERSITAAEVTIVVVFALFGAIELLDADLLPVIRI